MFFHVYMGKQMNANGFDVLQWKLHLFELEEEMKIDPSIKYVLYQVLI